jgi:hypothetical protein
MRISKKYHQVVVIIVRCEYFIETPDSSVSIVSRQRTGQLGVRIPVEARCFVSSKIPGRFSGPPSLLLDGQQVLPPAQKGESVVNHSSTGSVEVKN